MFEDIPHIVAFLEKSTEENVGVKSDQILTIIELSIKSSKENTELVSLLKTGNKVVEVG
jgi:hypothetical protein